MRARRAAWYQPFLKLLLSIFAFQARWHSSEGSRAPALVAALVAVARHLLCPMET